jgi:hypothetical protein
MTGDSFVIEFSYKGWPYTGKVTINETIFTVRYALIASPQYEKSIELNAVVCAGDSPLEWEEANYDPLLRKSNKALIKVIGEALEDREI